MNQVKDIDFEDLNSVEELNISSAPLWAGAHHIGNICKDVNTQYMQKRYVTKDPRACIEEGKAVTACALGFFKKMKEHCMEEFGAHMQCMNMESMMYGKCRKTQKPYDECVFKNFNVESIQSNVEGPLM